MLTLVCLVLLVWSEGIDYSHAFTGTTELMGYVEEINLGQLTIVVDGNNVEFAPNIPVKRTNGKKLSIFQVSVGEFVNAKVIPFGDNWKASSLILVDEDRIKSVTSYVSSIKDNTLKLGNGQLLLIPKKPKFEGFSEFEKDMMIRVDGYISGNRFKIWKFVSPYDIPKHDYAIYGELTKYQEDKLYINSQIVILHNGFNLLNEKGFTESNLSPIEGMKLRIICNSKSNVLHLNKCELFESIRLQLTRDSKTVTINKREESIPFSIISKKDHSLVPIKSIYDLCSLPIHIDEKENIITSRINYVELTYNMDTGELKENGHLIRTVKFSAERKGKEYMIPLNAFAFLFCNDQAYQYPLISSKEDIVIIRY